MAYLCKKNNFTMRKTLLTTLIALLALGTGAYAQRIIPASRYGIRPDTRADMSPRIQKMLKDLRKRTAQGEEIVLQFAPGRYDFHPDRAAERTYYISNHDQDNPKRVGIPLEGLKNVTLDGGGASFVFHGRMLPVSLLESEGCTLKNFSIVPSGAVGAMAAYAGLRLRSLRRGMDRAPQLGRGVRGQHQAAGL